MAYVGGRTTLYGAAALNLAPADGGVELTWSGRNRAWFEVAADHPTDLGREANGAMMLSVSLKLNAAPQGDVQLGMGKALLPIGGALKAAPIGAIQTLAIPLNCFAPQQDLSKLDPLLHLETAGPLDVTITDVRLVEGKAGASCPAN
jgi:beta-glucosidase